MLPWSVDDVLSQNVVAAWLTRRAGPPALRGTLILGVGGLAALLSLLTLTDLPRLVIDSLIYLPLVIVILMPLFIAPLTASLTCQELTVNDLELLVLTNLSASKLVRGWIAAATYRLRVGLAVAGGLLVLPVLAAIWASLLAWQPGLIDLLSLVYWTLCVVAFVAGLWLLSLLAVALGVRLAFRWRDPRPAAALAVLVAALLVGVALVMLGVLFWLTAHTSPWLFGGFSIFVSVMVPIRLREGQVSGAVTWVTYHVLHLPPPALVPLEAAGRAAQPHPTPGSLPPT